MNCPQFSVSISMFILEKKKTRNEFVHFEPFVNYSLLPQELVRDAHNPKQNRSILLPPPNLPWKEGPFSFTFSVFVIVSWLGGARAFSALFRERRDFIHTYIRLAVFYFSCSFSTLFPCSFFLFVRFGFGDRTHTHPTVPASTEGTSCGGGNSRQNNHQVLVRLRGNAGRFTVDCCNVFFLLYKMKKDSQIPRLNI